MASIDQMKYFPGTFSDEDASAILFPEVTPPEYAADGILVMKGRYGEYFRRESDGKIVNLQRGKKASSYTPELIDLLFSLPKAVGKDGEGNEITLNSGPFGVYARYCGRNYRVPDPFNVDIGSIMNPKSEEPRILKEFPPFEDKPLVIIDGRYGAYLKWGDKNCPLTKAEKEDPSSVTEERAHELAVNTPEKKTYRRRFQKKS